MQRLHGKAFKTINDYAIKIINHEKSNTINR